MIPILTVHIALLTLTVLWWCTAITSIRHDTEIHRAEWRVRNADMISLVLTIHHSPPTWPKPSDGDRIYGSYLGLALWGQSGVS